MRIYYIHYTPRDPGRLILLDQSLRLGLHHICIYALKQHIQLLLAEVVGPFAVLKGRLLWSRLPEEHLCETVLSMWLIFWFRISSTSFIITVYGHSI